MEENTQLRSGLLSSFLPSPSRPSEGGPVSPHYMWGSPLRKVPYG